MKKNYFQRVFGHGKSKKIKSQQITGTRIKFLRTYKINNFQVTESATCHFERSKSAELRSYRERLFASLNAPSTYPPASNVPNIPCCVSVFKMSLALN